MGNGTPERISISTETLRTEIRLANAELELSLRKYIGTELEKKASADIVVKIEGDLTRLARTVVLRDGPIMRQMEAFETDMEKWRVGEFTPAQTNAISSRIQAALTERTNAGWTKRERSFAVFGVIFWLCSISLSAASLLLR